MKKLTLIFAVMLFWGCSHAQDEDAAKEAVAAEAKEVIAETVDTAKEQATAQVKQTLNADYQPGIHYQVINPAWDTGQEDKVVVYEFFGYLCPHCATFEPYMKKLQTELPAEAELVRVPVVFYPQWKPYAQAYYTFEAMGLVDQAHEGMFNAIHQHKKQFRTIEEIAVWVASSYGVDKDKFLSTAKSFMVDGQIRKGMQMMQAMGVSSTPTLVTNGKFTPNAKSLKSRNDLIEVTDYLVDMEIENMGLNK